MQFRNTRRLLQTCTIFAVPALIAAGAWAADRPPALAIAWQCTQETDASFHVFCTPRKAGADTSNPSPAPSATPASDGVAPVADMRPVAQRGDAEVFSAPAWRLPLHARPTDSDMVEQLLTSVLCGTHPACRVSYGNERIRVAGG